MNNRPTFTPDLTVNQTQYYWFEKGFSEEEIDMVLSGSLDYNSKDGTVIGNQEQVEDSIRKSKVKWLPNTAEWAWLYEKLAGMAVEANNALWKFDLHSIIDDIQFTEYEEGGGHYDWHMDIGPDTISHRKISMVVQLTDPEEYEGGDLEMMLSRQPFAVPRSKGAVTLFPSFVMHKVTPITKGTRRSLVLWLGGSHFR